MIVDASYFYGDLVIAQTSQPAVLSSLNRFISQYEPKYMGEMLGYAIYKDFKDNPTDQKWTDLVDGAEYTNQYGTLSRWQGLKREVLAPVPYDAGPPEIQAVDGQYQSPIANYVYYWYLRNNATTTAGGGETTNNVSIPTSPDGKLARAWNEMVEWNRELIEFFYSNNIVYSFDMDTFYDANRLNLLTPINLLGF